MSTSVLSSPVSASSVNIQKLRNLDAFEETFWLFEQNVPIVHALTAEVEGATTVEQWQNALDAVQRKHPHLSASIRKIPGERPYFQSVQDAAISLRLVPLVEPVVLAEEMEKALQESFGDGSRELTRITLLHGTNRSVVVFASHHSSMDGKSHMIIVQDLLASVAGEDLGEPLEIQPGVGQLFGLPKPGAYMKTLEGRTVAPEGGPVVGLPRNRVQRLQLGVEETAALRKRAKEEQTTVHGALVAALALAGKRYSTTWKAGPVRCLSPIDIRQTLGNSGCSRSVDHGAHCTG